MRRWGGFLGLNPKIQFDADEIQPFVGVARQKGLAMCLHQSGEELERSVWHVDCDLIRLSVENARRRAEMQGKAEIAKRLTNLLERGTKVQQVNFVTAGHGTYFFPEDVEKMVLSGPKAAHPFRLEELSWLRCCATKEGTHFCEEWRARICVVFDSDGSLIDSKDKEQRSYK